MSKVRLFSFWNWIVVVINNLIEILGDSFCYIVQVFIVIFFSFFFNKSIQSYRSQIANCNFIRTSIFNNFCTKIRTFYSSEILLVRFSVTVIFVKHVRSSSFNLGFDNLCPKPSGFDTFSASSIFFILFVKFFKLFTPSI